MSSVLIVDDDRAIRDATKWLLESYGVVCHLAASKSEAFGLLEQVDVDVAILDIDLGDGGRADCDSIQIARMLVDRDIPFGFFSAQITDCPKELRELTQNRFSIGKPVRDQILFDALRPFIPELPTD